MKKHSYLAIRPIITLMIRMPVLSVKPGKARKLNSHCSMAVDTSEGVISHIQAHFADGRDSQDGIDPPFIFSLR
jgi:hypothetical protein